MATATATVKVEAPSCARPVGEQNVADAEPDALASASASVLPVVSGPAYPSCRAASDLQWPG